MRNVKVCIRYKVIDRTSYISRTSDIPATMMVARLKLNDGDKEYTQIILVPYDRIPQEHSLGP